MVGQMPSTASLAVSSAASARLRTPMSAIMVRNDSGSSWGLRSRAVQIWTSPRPQAALAGPGEKLQSEMVEEGPEGAGVLGIGEQLPEGTPQRLGRRAAGGLLALAIPQDDPPPGIEKDHQVAESREGFRRQIPAPWFLLQRAAGAGRDAHP